jgi:hypothetical protein
MEVSSRYLALRLMAVHLLVSSSMVEEEGNLNLRKLNRSISAVVSSVVDPQTQRRQVVTVVIHLLDPKNYFYSFSPDLFSLSSLSIHH